MPRPRSPFTSRTKSEDKRDEKLAEKRARKREKSISGMLGQVSFTATAVAAQPTIVRLGVIGDPGTGKTALIDHWMGKTVVAPPSPSSGDELAAPVVGVIPASDSDSDDPDKLLESFDSVVDESLRDSLSIRLRDSGSRSPSASSSGDLDEDRPAEPLARGAAYETSLRRVGGSLFLRNRETPAEVRFSDGSKWCANHQKFGAEEDPFADVDGLIVCYDISDPAKVSYENLDRVWKPQLDQHNAGENRPVLVLGTKGDRQHAMDVSLIKMIKKWITMDAVCSAVSGDGCDEALDTILDECIGIIKIREFREKRESLSKMEDRGDVGDFPHAFRKVYFKKPTWCMFCTDFIWGVTNKQGMECASCGFQCHKRCRDQVPHFCGIRALPEKKSDVEQPPRKS